MLQNPIHLRLERLESWQHVTFMACLCERMYPNYAMFCKQTEFGDGQIYRRILDLIWETLTVKDAKVNFDSQLEKFEEAIPAADDYDLYGVYPAIDACVALSELMHSRLSGETLKPDLDSWAISHIERRQNHSSVEVSVAWLEAPEGSQLLLVANSDFCHWQPQAKTF